MLRATRPLYLMIKPPPATARHIAALPQASRRRAAGLLHMTVMPLGDRTGMPASAVAALIAVVGTIPAAAFRVVFDRIAANGRTCLLHGSEPIRGALAFQRGLADALAKHGLADRQRYRFAPHVTLDYDTAARGEWAVDPISWRVDNLLLIESVVGEGRHVELDRRPLHETADTAPATA